MRNFTMVGRLTADPKLETTNSGKQVANFSLAVRKSKDKTHFFNCSAWEGTGKLINQYAKKGSMIAVSGQINQRSWQGEDGKTQYRIDFVVREVDFTGSGSGSGGAKKEDSFGEVVDGPGFEDSGIPFDDDIPF